MLKWLCKVGFHRYKEIATRQIMMASMYSFLECSCNKKIVRYEQMSMAGMYTEDMSPEEYLRENPSDREFIENWK